ncbi:MAG TPA: addiction module protein [Verrucomicrobiaceae bacterium]
MSTLLADLVNQSRLLPENERIGFALWLLDEKTAENVVAEAAWDEEIRARIRAVDEGRARGMPFGQAMAELDQRLKR